MEADFSGYVTRHGMKCTDGRTILPPAFKGDHGQSVPLVWQHQHNSPENVLGHIVLSHREEGVWGEGFFNATPPGLQAKALVMHKDIKGLSIYANQLVERALNVMHGAIKEVSLVMAGANPGAFIQNIRLAHSDEVLEDEAVMFFGEQDLLMHASTNVPGPRKIPLGNNGPIPNPTSDDDGDEANESVADVIESMTPKQKKVAYAMVGQAMQQSASGNPNPTSQKDGEVHRNVFDKTGDQGSPSGRTGATLSHADMKGILVAAQECGSLRQAVKDYALAHGIDSIETLFPYDKAVSETPEFITRRVEWVQGVLGGVRRVPFSRIRSWTADLTHEDARAKGYIKGSLKKEQFFKIARRITTPTTVYKKQKLDRDDVVDITDFDVVQWMQTELRLMLDEEVARAILMGDGRDVSDEDHINVDNIRPILDDDELYVTTLEIDLTDGSSTADEIVDGIISSLRFYRGSGTPTLYTTRPYLAQILVAKDTLGRRLYNSIAEVATAMGVDRIIAVEAMESVPHLIGIIVNLTDYTVGADKGGEVNMFDFFDIDFNQLKYLLETRLSGAMTKYKGALVLKEFTGAGGMLVDPTPPTFNTATGVVTIPTTSHVTYVTVAADGTESSALTAGAQTAIAAGTEVHVRAKAASTYSFPNDAEEDWFFTRDS